MGDAGVRGTPRIFISYRKDDTGPVAARLSDALRQRFGQDQVFRDVDTLRGGQDYATAIDRDIRDSDVVLVLIGERWLNATDEQGRRRLEDPEDVLVSEVATALSRGKVTIPVRVEGAPMPQRSQLPKVLEDLALRQAVQLSDSRWEYDVGRIVAEIGLPWFRRVLAGPTLIIAGLALVLAAIVVGALLMQPKLLNPEIPVTAAPATPLVSTPIVTREPTLLAVVASSTPATERIYDGSVALEPGAPDNPKMQAAMTFAWMLRTLNYSFNWREVETMLGVESVAGSPGTSDVNGVIWGADLVESRLRDYGFPATARPVHSFDLLSARAGRQPLVVCSQSFHQCAGVRGGQATRLELVHPDEDFALGKTLLKDEFSAGRWGNLMRYGSMLCPRRLRRTRQ